MSTNNNRANGVARKGLSVPTHVASTTLEQVFALPTVGVARALIGATLRRVVPPGQPHAGRELTGRIVETEAYLPLVDPACHGYRGPTPRNDAIFGRAGRAYIYFIYGNHFCFNVTTEPAGIGGAVLIRALEPLQGVDVMRRRRPAGTPDAALACGPGNLCCALGIDRSSNGTDLRYGALTIELPGAGAPHVDAGPRIGIREAADWPLRFIDASSASVYPFRRRTSVSHRKSR